VDLITTHVNADFDGLASMVAARKLYPGATLMLSGGGQEAVRSFLAVHDLELVSPKQLDHAAVTRLILVDTQEPERLGALADLWQRPEVSLHIYDHHPVMGAGLPDDVPVRLRPAVYAVEPVGATTTILIERLRAQRLAITPFEATVLALGLYEETGSLAFVSTTPRDLQAAAYAVEAGADLRIVTDTLRRPLDPDQIVLLNDLVQSGDIYYIDGRKVLVTSSGYDRYKGDLAEVVHKLAEMQGLDVVVAAMALEEKVEVIGRSRRPEFDMGALMREFGGGGHDVAAAAAVKGKTVVEVRERITQWLTDRRQSRVCASEIMTKPVKSVGAVATMLDVERLMTTYGVNALPVVDARDRYLGVVTREIVQKALFHKLNKSPVGDYMSAEFYTAAPETPFREIEARMIERNQRFVPILSGQTVVGVITRTDVLRSLHDDVLAAARARAKGFVPATDHHRRNLRGAMMSHLPARGFILLEAAGRLADEMEVSVYVVGGFVRDLLLDVKNLDLDLVVEGDGIAFAQALAAQVQGQAKEHERFGTAVVTSPDGLRLDIATARTEYYEYPTALPTVEQSSIKKDLYRRDFTINTMAIVLNEARFGELVDYFGGQRDLKDKTIRVLHSLSFVEDPTRVFRAVRFEQRLGFRLAKETLVLVKGAAKMDLFKRLSGTRLFNELVLLFSEDEPSRTVGRLGELDLLRFVHPSLKASPALHGLLKGIEDAVKWYHLLYLEREAEPWLAQMMALLDGLSAKALGETLKRLAVPERQAEAIRRGHVSSEMVLRRLTRQPAPSPAELYRLLSPMAVEALLLVMAKAKSETVQRHISAFLTTHQHVKPILSGDDLKGMGLKPGPQFKKILGALLDARLNGEVETETDERALVSQLAKS
jgi:tRNA nucleotidyltransferase (CCA-adding enzyme)